MIEQRVMHGDHFGRTIGYPTANVDCTPESTGLTDGVYAATVQIHGGVEWYHAALIINRKRNRVEVHLIGFSGDLYGKKLLIQPGKKVSEYISIEDIEALKQKISDDIKKILCIQE